jgi:NarL family two-component system response regulator LiaR
VNQKIRVLIVDDHLVVREGLRALIGGKPDMEVVGEAEDGREAVRQARSCQPDVILMDLVMPGTDGIQAIKEIRGDDDHARILVLTSYSEDRNIFEAIKAGALGYLLKDSSAVQLTEAIRQVSRGELTLQPSIAGKLMQELNRPPNLPPTEQPLTAREVEVLKLLARGLSNQEIAQALVISERTVTTHVSNILGKLHLANRTQAALYALREGFARWEEP